MGIKWTDKAKANLAELRAYLLSKGYSSPKAIIKPIISDIDNLETFPMMGKIDPKFNSQKIRYILSGKYRVVYLLKDELAYILTVTHATYQYYYLHIDPDNIS